MRLQPTLAPQNAKTQRTKARNLRSKSGEKTPKGVEIPRRFTTAGVDPYSEVTWELRSAAIASETGATVFEQKDIEVPSFWSQLATNVVASKYFRGTIGTPGRERSVRQLIERVAGTLTHWGVEGGYFLAKKDAEAFHDELVHLLLHQKLAFNSPVWFNVGVEVHPQCSACFINEVKDSMESILDLAKTEGMLFKYGSGTGTNLSPIRSSRELLRGGGEASGPVSFMRGYDAFAGVIKSGGKTRRAAKMVILNVDHPDIEEFIVCKAKEERKAWALIDAGYDGSFTGEAYASVFFQNSNNSVRVTDDFMRAVVEDKEWHTRAVIDGARVVGTYRARDLWRKMSEAAWQCGDPGMQFDTTVNEWHTCANTDRINASNPCSEYMFLDNSACNLASLNLMRFRRDDGELDTAAFQHAVDVGITAMEIIVGFSRYPTEAIERNSHAYRPLGLGYANLGALLMARGLPYDSDAGRAMAATLTALMAGRAYRQSAVIAGHTGPYEGFAANRAPALKVLDKHRFAMRDIDHTRVPRDLYDAAKQDWNDAAELAAANGLRNSQLTVIAPTGTIAFMMDCDTTGIEPDIALVKYKKLVGGGLLKIVNRTVPEALERLGHSKAAGSAIIQYVDEHETIEGAPGLADEHLGVFDCAFRPANGRRSIAWTGHIKMMAAVQPFISGAISKTVNMPPDSTVEDIERAYMMAWKYGLKAIAIYRDGCKRSQPLNTSKKQVTDHTGAGATGGVAAGTGAAMSAADAAAALGVAFQPRRRKMPIERRSLTHKFSIGGHEGYITAGTFEDGTLGEMFIRMAKEGSTVSGLMDSFATMTSLALQYGVPLQVLVDKLSHTRFEPSGFTGNPEIPMAKSLMDYVFRWLAARFLPRADATAAGVALRDPVTTPEAAAAAAHSGEVASTESDAVWGPGAEARPPAAAGALPAARANGNGHGANGNGNGHNGNGHGAGQGQGHHGTSVFVGQADAPSCPDCGAIMVRNAACYKCLNCGATNGCS
jgi:ribonucleoside-diphosphate reductase alpha chain